MTWGGRFSSGPDPEMLRLTDSLAIDIRLLTYDVAATKAHARALLKSDLISEDEFGAITDTLDEILARAGSGEDFGDAEDVHSLVESFLTERLGDTGARIHAGRSRNDLVAADLRLFCRDASGRAIHGVASLIETICRLARIHAETIMPGYTHLQRAQPVTLGFHLLAHGFALERDAVRFQHALESADVSPLGAGALASTTLPIDSGVAAAELGFAQTFDNAMDAVAARDFAVDLVFACASVAVTLSRLAEELILWCTSEFGFARPSDEWSTGSSMMPQKRNPDMAELIRGRSASTIADLQALLVLLKGLPLAYDRDLQEDKAIVFRAIDRTEGALVGMERFLAALQFDVERMRDAAAANFTWATDVAEHLVGRGVPFRRAHEIAGRLVASLESSGSDVTDLSATDLAEIDPELASLDVYSLEARSSVERRAQPGGPAHGRVMEQADRLEKTIHLVLAPLTARPS